MNIFEGARRVARFVAVVAVVATFYDAYGYVPYSEGETYVQNWREHLVNLFIGIGVFYAGVWSIGWIVRGFLGIPRGLDRAP